MSVNARRTQEGIDEPADHVGWLADELSRSFTIGTDEEGADHHYWRPWDAVIVYNGRDLETIQRLNGRPIIEYLDFVEAEGREWVSFGQFANLGINVDARRKGVDR